MEYLTAIPFIAAGAAVGALYFLLLYGTVRIYTSGAGTALAAPLFVARTLAAVLFFWLVAHEGAVALLLALVGFLVARSVAQYLAKRA